MTKRSSMTKEQKQYFKTICQALNHDGYFTNFSFVRGWIMVMASNHDVLIGVWASLSQFENVIKVTRCSNPNVVMIVFK
jgi:hypothetical protein